MIKTFLTRTTNLVLHGEYIPNEFFIIDSHKVIYISIPKVACTSIKIALMGNGLSDSSSHGAYMNVHAATSRYMSRTIGRHQQGYFKFAFVRSPFDRLVSCYKDKIRTKLQHNGRYHFDTRYNTVLIYRLFGGKFHNDMSFEEFVGLVTRIPDFLSDGHFKSQYSMLYRKGSKIPDYIGKFENLAADWKHIADRYGFPELQVKNRTMGDDWRQLLY